MNEEVLGANHWLSRPARLHTVSPLSSAVSSGHFRIAPPHSSSESPRCFWYQSARALGSSALKNTPPMPVMRAMQAPYNETGILRDYRRDKAGCKGTLMSVVSRT